MPIASKTRVNIDRACSCLPILSSVNALIDLRQKAIYEKAVKNGSVDPKFQDVYHQRILKTKRWVFYSLLIPVVGQLIIGIWSIAKSHSKPTSPKTISPELQAEVDRCRQRLKDNEIAFENLQKNQVKFQTNVKLFNDWRPGNPMPSFEQF